MARLILALKFQENIFLAVSHGLFVYEYLYNIWIMFYRFNMLVILLSCLAVTSATSCSSRVVSNCTVQDPVNSTFSLDDVCSNVTLKLDYEIIPSTGFTINT